MIKKKVLVLLAAYNGSKYLEDQIDSIIKQKNIDVTILISLDLSSDDSESIINTLVDENKNISMLPYKNRFGSAGANFFNLMYNANHSDFDYIAFSDQDDIWLDIKLDKGIECLLDSKSDGYSSNVLAYWEDGKTKLIKKNYPQSEFDYLFESPGPGCTFILTNKLFSKLKEDVVLKYKKINDLWLHDWFIYSFARSKGYKWHIDDNSYMLYRQHSTNEVGANSGFKSFLKRVKLTLRGGALDKVIKQADFLNQEDCFPIKCLKENRKGSLKLAIIAYKCRRRLLHKIFCFIYFVMLFIIGNNRK